MKNNNKDFDFSNIGMNEIDSTANKRMRTTNYLQEDHISSMPQDIISDILSRLPTNEAVRTCVLSHNWERKWMFIDIIKIDDGIEPFCGENATASFTDVVTKILSTEKSRLNTFHLNCDRDYHFGHLEKWILYVLKRNVQNLKILAPKIKGPDSPWCFSSWTSLAELILDISCTLKVPAGNCFRNLMRLSLFGAEHGGIKIMTTKLPGTSRAILVFPVLAMLHLIDCEWLDVNSVEIQAPELLKYSTSDSGEIKIEIKICGPKLAVFELVGHGPVNNHILSAPQAVTIAAFANRHRDETSAVNAHKILTKLAKLKCLRIHGRTLKALLRLRPRLKFPTFDLLKEFECKFNCDVKDVLELLQVLPTLESLIIQVATLVDYDFGEASTPKIKRVTLLKYSETNGQVNFVKYLLDNANSLEEMTIDLLKTVGIGKPVDMVEAIVQSLTKLKPIRSRCKFVLNQKEVNPNTWFGPFPVVVTGEGSRSRLVKHGGFL